MCRPVHRLTLAEQLQRTLRMEKKGGFGRLLGKIARTALSGVAVYVSVNILSGKAGQKRLRQDFAIVAVSPHSLQPPYLCLAVCLPWQ